MGLDLIMIRLGRGVTLWCIMVVKGDFCVLGGGDLTEENGCATFKSVVVRGIIILLDIRVVAGELTSAIDYSNSLIGRCQDTRYGIGPSCRHHNI